MRKSTVRRGIRSICVGVVALIVATFFHSDLAIIFRLGLEGEGRLTFVGFFLAGMFGGFGVLLAALGLLQSGTGESRLRLLPSIVLLFCLIGLFFVLTYTWITSPQSLPLAPGDSINI
jgi:hypothetical protein